MLTDFREKQPHSDERELVEAPCREDRGAFKTLYELYRDRVCNLVFYSLGEALWAEVVPQIVFLKTYRELPGIRYEGALSTWAYGVALNECKNQLQRQGARYVPLDALSGSDEEFDTCELPDGRQLDRARRRILRDAVMRLSPKLRAVMVLKGFPTMRSLECCSALRNSG